MRRLWPGMARSRRRHRARQIRPPRRARRHQRLIVNMPAFRALMSAHDTLVHNTRRMNARQTRAMLEAAGFRVRRLGYWNSLLLPLMVLRRKLPFLSSGGSDVAAFPPWLDRILHGMTELERRLPVSFPGGGSVMALVARP